MPNRFGLRHLVLGGILLALVVLVWLNMLQLDRLWARLGEVKATQAQLEQAIVRLEQRGVPVAPPVQPNGSVPPGPGSTNGVSMAPAAEAWARPGVPIIRKPRPSWINDPTHNPDFSVGGTLTEALESEPPKLTPYVATGVQARRVLELVQQRLADYNPKTLEMEGILADAWQVDPAGTSLRVKIRDDAVWSDGEPVTADDLRFTMNLINKDSRYNLARFRGTYSTISDVEVLGPKTAEFKFSEPVYLNVDVALRLAPLPAHFYSRFAPEQFNQSTGLLLGSGPYMLAGMDPEHQWVPGSPIELVRNPRFRLRPTAPDKYRFVIIKSAPARLTALQNNDIDLMRAGPEHLAAAPKDAPPGKPRGHEWTNVQSPPVAINWNCGPHGAKGGPGPTADVRFRRAVSMALDREYISRDLLGGGAPIITGPYRPDSPAYDPEIKPPRVDLQAAGSMLSEAGWTLGTDAVRRTADGRPLEFTLIYGAGAADYERVAIYIADQCKRIGINCNRTPADPAAFEAATRTREFDAILVGWGSDSPEPNPYQRFHSDSIKDQRDNYVQWSNPEADRVIMEGRREFDDAKRNALWRRLHRLIDQDQPYTYLFLRPSVFITGPRLGNFVAYRTWYESAEFYVVKPAGP